MSSSANSWSCTISLRFEFDDKGTSLSSPTTHQFGPVLRDKNQFEIFLRRAQAAILEPNRPRNTFLQMTVQELKDTAQSNTRLKFSKNIVCVDIVDPEAAELAFIDCPGLSICHYSLSSADHYHSRFDSE